MRSGKHQRSRPDRSAGAADAPAGSASGLAAPGPARHRTIAGAVALLAVVAVVVAVVIASTLSGHHRAAAAPVTTTGSSSAASATSAQTSAAPRTIDTARAKFIPPGGNKPQAPVAAPKAAPAPTVPVRVQVPSLGIDSSLESLKVLPNGAMQAPTQWMRAGWFAAGTRPGAVGPAIIAGHVDAKTSPGVFLRLSAIKVGASIIVTTRTKQVFRFTVTDLKQYPKAQFPAQAVYGPTPLAELRLITCAGDFDRKTGHYVDNLVVSSVLDS